MTKASSTIGVAVLGAGRMGQEHARNLLGIGNARVVAIADPFQPAREAAQQLTRAEKTFADPLEAIHDPNVDAVIIVTPTNTHAELIEAAARAGKAIFCEKPVALGLERTRQALEVVKAKGVAFQIGFNRRFDPSYALAKQKIGADEIGEIEQFISVMRDPAPPALEYLKISGGMFLDQSIHELDCARFLVGEVEEISAWGAVLIDPAIGELGDVDTGMITMRFKNGALGVIQNSRRSAYGYDVRSEVFGSKGKLVMEATPKTPLTQFGPGSAKNGRLEQDHFHFFMDRFKDAYRLELEAFMHCLEMGTIPTPGPFDALESLRLGVAATRSLKEGRPIKLAEITV